MPKRRMDNQLTKDDFDRDDEEPVEQGFGMEKASENVIKERKIIKRKRTKGSVGGMIIPSDTSQPSGSFSFGATSQTNPNFSFDFNPSSSSTNFNFTGASTTENDKSSEIDELIKIVDDVKQRLLKLKENKSTSNTTAILNSGSTGGSVKNQLKFDFGGSSENAFAKVATGVDASINGWNNSYVPSEDATTTSKPKPAADLPKEKPKSGEEGEEKICHFRVKVHEFQTVPIKSSEENKESKKEDEEKEEEEKDQKTEQKWVERGVGELRINKMDNGKHRMVMRTEKIFKLVINSLIFKEMTVKKVSDKKVMVSAFGDDGKLKSFLISFQKLDDLINFSNNINDLKAEM